MTAVQEVKALVTFTMDCATNQIFATTTGVLGIPGWPRNLSGQGRNSDLERQSVLV